MFRKFIINHFALYYITKFGNFPRAANWIFPGFITMGLSMLVWQRDIWCYLSLMYIWITLFFGFIYFRWIPIKESEYSYLTATQKIAYDKALDRNSEIPNTYDPIWIALWNPLWILMFIILYCIYN